MNVNHQTATEARAEIFLRLLNQGGILKRGVLISRMHISVQTFDREVKTYMEMYPQIKYEKETREFSYQP